MILLFSLFIKILFLNIFKSILFFFNYVCRLLNYLLIKIFLFFLKNQKF